MDRSLTRAERLKSLEALLYRTPGGVTASQVADRLDVHRSTAYLDLRSLAQTGAPVWQDGSRFGLPKDGYLATVCLDLQEALALYLAARLLAAHSDEHNPQVIGALLKLAGAVPQPMADHMERTARAAGRCPADGGYVRALETLTRAWADGRQVELTYRGPRDEAPMRRTFDTWFIEPSATGLACYAIGLDLRGALRTFEVERIHRVAGRVSGPRRPERGGPHSPGHLGRVARGADQEGGRLFGDVCARLAGVTGWSGSTRKQSHGRSSLRDAGFVYRALRLAARREWT